MQRLISFFIAAALSSVVSVRSCAADHLPTVLDGATFEGCAALPTPKCVLILAREVALSVAEREVLEAGAANAKAVGRDEAQTGTWFVQGAKRQAAESLAKVAAAQAKAGLRDDAEATIELVRSPLDEVPPLDRYETIPNLVEALATLGKFNEALSFAKSPGSPFDLGLTTIAIHLAHAGRLSQGLGMLLPLPPFQRHFAIRRFAWAMRYIALERGEEGILIDALRLVERHEWSYSHTGVQYVFEFPPALSIFARPLAEMGRFDEAWRLALSVRSDWERPQALAELAVLQVRAGGISLCVRRLFAVEDGQLRSSILERTLEGLVSKTPLEKRMSYGVDEGVPLRPGRIAETASEDLAQALNLAKAFPADRDRDFALGLVVAAQMQSRASSEAWRTARSILDSEARYFSFRAIGQTEASKSHSLEAKTAYEEAAAIAKTLDCRTQPRPCAEGRPLVSVAREMAHAGLVKEAFDVVAAMKERSSSALYAIAQAQARLGATDDALTTARIPEADNRAYGLRTGIVAFELAKGGHIAEAISIANLQAAHDRRWTLDVIARERTAAGSYQQALQIIEAMENGKERVFALAGIGWEESHAGQHSNANEMFARALRAAQAEHYAYSCVTSLLHIASSMGTEPVAIDYNDIYGVLPLLEAP